MSRPIATLRTLLVLVSWEEPRDSDSHTKLLREAHREVSVPLLEVQHHH